MKFEKHLISRVWKGFHFGVASVGEKDKKKETDGRRHGDGGRRFCEVMNDSARADERVDERFCEVMNVSARAETKRDESMDGSMN